MKDKLAVFALALFASSGAFADGLIYDAGTAPSHGPQGEEVTIEEPDTMGEAKQTGKDRVDIEKPCSYDANSVPQESETQVEEMKSESN
jgi:hypothetical protein